ncbi:MAG: GxxExxY protein [Candidatus Nealsonbacteria bacterium]
MTELLYRNESYKIRGACFNVYNVLGGGIKEKIIEKALIQELLLQGFKVENQLKIDILYKGEKVGVYVLDILVNEKIILEIKSKLEITTEDKKQFWSYLKGSDYKLGFLIVFSPKKLLIKRFIHTKKNLYKSV